MQRHTVILIAGGLLAGGVRVSTSAAEPEPARPPVVEPRYDGQPVPPPAGAVVLFDGRDVSRWVQEPRGGAKGGAKSGDTAVKWKVADGVLEVVAGTGFLRTREPLITSGHLHVEWATPAKVQGEGQGRGNSGVFIDGFPEVQVLDSFDNETYPDGQAGALYKRSVPLANASRRPGEWQCYDIIVERAVVEGGKVVREARITVRHNQVLIQDGVKFSNPSQAGKLGLQDHKNPVRFRNIWFKPEPAAAAQSR